VSLRRTARDRRGMASWNWLGGGEASACGPPDVRAEEFLADGVFGIHREAVGRRPERREGSTVSKLAFLRGWRILSRAPRLANARCRHSVRSHAPTPPPPPPTGGHGCGS